MIYLTCDIHQSTMCTLEHEYLSDVPTLLAENYTSICLKNNIKHTHFYTGQAISENPEVVKRLVKTNYVEIGGHTYNAFRYGKLSLRLRGLTRSKYHWLPLQCADIWRTTATFVRNGLPVPQSWRTHSYASDFFTPLLLRMNGYNYISDEKKEGGKPYKKCSGIISVPINVLPDHEHLVHGPKCELKVKDRGWEGDCFGNTFLEKEQWMEKLLRQIYNNEKSNIDSVILIHAECMDALDRMHTFEDICREIRVYRSGFVKEIVLT